MNAEIIQKAGEVIRQNTAHGAAEGAMPYCALALIDKDGYPTASTITASKAEGIHTIWFCTGLSGNKVERIERCGRAGVCFNTGGGYNITLVGTVEILTEPALKKEMWYTGLEQHFSGAEDPNYCVLRFTAKRYNLFVDWQEEAGTL